MPTILEFATPIGIIVVRVVRAIRLRNGLWECLAMDPCGHSLQYFYMEPRL